MALETRVDLAHLEAVDGASSAAGVELDAAIAELDRVLNSNRFDGLAAQSAREVSSTLHGHAAFLREVITAFGGTVRTSAQEQMANDGAASSALPSTIETPYF